MSISEGSVYIYIVLLSFLLFPQINHFHNKAPDKKGGEGGKGVARRPQSSFLKPNWKSLYSNKFQRDQKLEIK